MSQIHKVILLNKPTKIMNFTVIQWIFIGVCVLMSALVASKVPQDWKWQNIPMGFIVAFLFITFTVVFITAAELRPFVWWRNMFIYRLGLTSTRFLPRPESAPVYPDPTIIDAKKKEDDFYIGS